MRARSASAAPTAAPTASPLRSAGGRPGLTFDGRRSLRGRCGVGGRCAAGPMGRVALRRRGSWRWCACRPGTRSRVGTIVARLDRRFPVGGRGTVLGPGATRAGGVPRACAAPAASATSATPAASRSPGSGGGSRAVRRRCRGTFPSLGGSGGSLRVVRAMSVGAGGRGVVCRDRAVLVHSVSSLRSMRGSAALANVGTGRGAWFRRAEPLQFRLSEPVRRRRVPLRAGPRASSRTRYVLLRRSRSRARGSPGIRARRAAVRAPPRRSSISLVRRMGSCARRAGLDPA